MPDDRVGRTESLRRLREVLLPVVAESYGRVTPTLAGTALLISSPSGASEIVTGVPGAVKAVGKLFGRTSRGVAPVRGATAPAKFSYGVFAIDAPLRVGTSWEAFSWWFANLAIAAHPYLHGSSARALSGGTALAVELDASGIRSTPAAISDGVGGHVRLVIDGAAPASIVSEILASLDDATEVASDRCLREVCA